MLSHESGAMFSCKKKEEFSLKESLPLLSWVFADRIELQIFFFFFLKTAHNTNKLIWQRCSSVIWKMRGGMACNVRGLVYSDILCSNKLKWTPFVLKGFLWRSSTPLCLCDAHGSIIHPSIPQIHSFCQFPSTHQ